MKAARAPGNPHDSNVSGTQDKRDAGAVTARLKRDDPDTPNTGHPDPDGSPGGLHTNESNDLTGLS